jgi:hypothetical protein
MCGSSILPGGASSASPSAPACGQGMQYPQAGHRTIPEPDNPFWSLLGTLDDGPRLAYEAAKFTNLSVLVHDEDWTTRVTTAEGAQSALAAVDAYHEGVAAAVAAAAAKHAANVARWGGPTPAAKGAPALIGHGQAVHAFATFGQFGVELTAVGPGLLCGTPRRLRR